ncbi:STN domain-containing protein [Niabella ginsengisoli]|uniref:STN domain-containing protein n=1 Tax=Niabella ginsengisoli TaxID=522298 RepID=A0ABS9SET4_9BACT|nr:STN domain-containing protein [Niabella ginsengisoli]MCH5596877.1 STN domain-containing protein [Niabella ginsengisoli]
MRQITAVYEIIYCLFLAATLPAFAGASGQTVTFSKKNVSLEKVFVEIRKQTGYNFLYNDALLAKSKKITVSAKRMPLKDMLDLIFSNQPLAYSILDKTVVVKEDRFKKYNRPTL